MTGREAGVYPLASALDQEGFGRAGAVQVTESFARHLMRALDAWQADGFDAIARIAVHRSASGGEVRESFRRLQLREGQRHGKAFSFMEVEDDAESDGTLNLANLSEEQGRR